MANPWFRVYAEFATDAKVQMLTEAMQRRYLMLMCLRCSNALETLHDDEIAFQLRISDAELAETKAELALRGFITGSWDLVTPIEIGPDRPLSHVWKAIRTRIFQRDDYTCQYCGERGKKLECDHVIPVARGGHHGDDNLVAACFACNRSKRDKLVSEWKSA